jgi:ABC-type dipeptide/oligopeptide/nickel transport system permease subunit
MMTAYASIETAQPLDLTQNVWKRFRRHRGAIAGVIIFGMLVIMIALAPLSHFDPEASNLPEKFSAPSPVHWLGTDALGRDLFTRILYGGRISLSVGGIAVAISLLIGVPIGALAGYYGGRLDSILMRLTDAFLSLPSFLVLISARGNSSRSGTAPLSTQQRIDHQYRHRHPLMDDLRAASCGRVPHPTRIGLRLCRARARFIR